MKFLICSLLVVISLSSFGQVLKFDQLEMYYDQGHYKSVYRKANRLLDNPEYDYSKIPVLYKSLSTFQLSRNDRWRNRRKEALSKASALFMEVKNDAQGKEILEAHIYETSELKKDLISWAEDLKIQNKIDLFTQINAILNDLFDDVPNLMNQPSEHQDSDEVTEEVATLEYLNITKQRREVLKLAEQQLGVPYVWAGKSPSGFDCSGFTSYVLESQNIAPPRRAIDQKSKSKKVKRKDVQPGDLVFFDSGSGISHVGMVISLNDNSIQMIHASSSKGISIVDIYKSSYWSKRIDSFGTYF